MDKSSRRKLFRLVQSGQLWKLKQFVDTWHKKIPDLNLDIKSGDMSRTPLHVACLLGDDSMVRCLLNYGADGTVSDRHGDTPLHLAAKYVGEDGNYANYKLLMDPLIKSCPEAIDLKNEWNETPSDLLKEAKRKHKLLLEAKPLSYEEEFGKKFFSDRWSLGTQAITDKAEWEEKLANSLDEDCADAGMSDPYLEDEEWVKNIPEYPTFDQWADRMAAEYRRKQQAKAEDKKKKKADIRRMKVSDSASISDRLEREREKFRRKIAQKNADRLKSRLESYRSKLSDHMANDEADEKKLRFTDIPWPCLGTITEMMEVIMSGYSGPLEDFKEKRKYVRKQQILWHPDKFLQRCTGRLNEDDEESILDTVKLLSQKLNEILETF